jgi:hypothetical protein
LVVVIDLDDFGTSMPFKSPGGVHLIICAF